MNQQLPHVTSSIYCPHITLRSALSDRAWAYMMRKPQQITRSVLAFADALALGGELRPAHLGIAIRRHRAGTLPHVHEETTA